MSAARSTPVAALLASRLLALLCLLAFLLSGAAYATTAGTVVHDEPHRALNATDDGLHIGDAIGSVVDGVSTVADQIDDEDEGDDEDGGDGDNDDADEEEDDEDDDEGDNDDDGDEDDDEDDGEGDSDDDEGDDEDADEETEDADEADDDGAAEEPEDDELDEGSEDGVEGDETEDRGEAGDGSTSGPGSGTAAESSGSIDVPADEPARDVGVTVDDSPPASSNPNEGASTSVPPRADAGDPRSDDAEREDDSGQEDANDQADAGGSEADENADGDDANDPERSPTPGASSDLDASEAASQEDEPASSPSTHVASVSANRSAVPAGESVRIDVVVRNDAGSAANRTVGLRLFGEVVDERSVTIPEDGLRRVSFVRRIESPGRYEASVGGVETTITVTGASESTPRVLPPQQTPGFTTVAALFGLLVAVLIARRRAS